VNISSGVRLVGVRGYSGYAASKHAEIGLTKSTALDDGHLGIRVTALCPGLVNTPLIAEMINENPTMHEELVASHASVASQSPRRSPTRSCGCPRHVPAT
jgi:NAD(P)-dependent dehydrogenase (short-subunit alcohol dehydrogenase family)